MPKGGNGGGKGGGGNGGGGSTPFEILGLTDASDPEQDETTSLQTGFVIEGTIDPSIVQDPNFDSLTIVIDGQEYDVPVGNIDPATGDWSYTYSGADLGPGQISVSAYYTAAHPRNGKLQDKQAVNTYSFEIEAAANTPATITGDTAGDVTEDDPSNASGLLDVTDPDPGENQLQAATQTSALGTFDVLANGDWTYTLDNGSAAVQALGAGVTTTDTISVTSADGTASEVITVTITGVNDAAVIGGVT